MNQGAETPTERKALIARIDKAMQNLALQKANLEKSLLPLSEQVQRGTWVIINTRHYQVASVNANSITLTRHDGNITISKGEFNSNFRLAKHSEVEAHIRFLNSKKRSYMTDDTITKPKTLLQAMTAPLSETVKENDWIIQTANNTYYQFNSLTSNKSVTWIVRHGVITSLLTSYINKNFRLANADEVQQHEDYLKRSGNRYTVRVPVQQTVNANSKPLINNLIKIFGEPMVNLTKELNKPSFDPMKCDFYLVTCRGLMGAKVRHLDYATAEKEAIRIAKKENHETWVLGVVSSVKPTCDTIVTKR